MNKTEVQSIVQNEKAEILPIPKNEEAEIQPILEDAEEKVMQSSRMKKQRLEVVPDHDGGRPMEVNACILITHMVYL